MLASFLLALREGIEAALIVGIVLGALRKMNRTQLNAQVWRGVIAAVGLSVVAALALNALGAEFEGAAEEIFEGAAMITAALLLTWMIVWMRRQAGSLKQEIESNVREAAGSKNSGQALFWLAFLAVGREGFELVLFLIAAQMSSDAIQTTIGAVIGLALALALGWMIFATSKRLSLQQFFSVTNVLLILFAAGLVAHGVHEFNEAGIIPNGIEHVWDVNAIINEKETFGQLLTALFGYNGNPSLTEVIAYWLYFAGLGLFWNKINKPIPAAEAA
jgi:high-affinity iron transporter